MLLPSSQRRPAFATPVRPTPTFPQVILPLYPQFSISTSGSSLRVLNEEFTRRPEQWGHKNVVHTVVPSYYDRPGYVNAMANLVANEVAQFTPEQQQEGVQVIHVFVHMSWHYGVVGHAGQADNV